MRAEAAFGLDRLQAGLHPVIARFDAGGFTQTQSGGIEPAGDAFGISRCDDALDGAAALVQIVDAVADVVGLERVGTAQAVDAFGQLALLQQVEAAAMLKLCGTAAQQQGQECQAGEAPA